MTHNQINYWANKEVQRHNVATESETQRHNLATEGETSRHNVQTEGVDIGKLSETQRHNRATEIQSANELGETRRHNIAQEGIGWTNAHEAIRHNVTQESLDLSKVTETGRHNLEVEEQGREDVITRRMRTEAQNALDEISTELKKDEKFNKLPSAQRQLIQAQINQINADIWNTTSRYDFDRLKWATEQLFKILN